MVRVNLNGKTAIFVTQSSRVKLRENTEYITSEMELLASANGNFGNLRLYEIGEKILMVVKKPDRKPCTFKVTNPLNDATEKAANSAKNLESDFEGTFVGITDGVVKLRDANRVIRQIRLPTDQLLVSVLLFNISNLYFQTTQSASVGDDRLASLISDYFIYISLRISLHNHNNHFPN